MGLMKKFFNQTRKPEGRLGRIMLSTMNSGHAKMAEWGMSHLPKTEPSQIIELGCGAGRNASELLKRYPSSSLTAVDYSSLSVEKAAEYNKEFIDKGRCKVVKADVSDLKMPENSYDLASAFETIYFWPGLDKCFAQVSRVIKQGGYFLICNESDGVDNTGKKFEGIIEGMTCYTVQEIEKYITSAGFSVVLANHHPNKPWIAILAKKV